LAENWWGSSLEPGEEQRILSKVKGPTLGGALKQTF